MAWNSAEATPRFSRYRVVAPLGAGGTANVFLALTESTAGFRKLVVLKRLLDHLADDDDLVEMFRHEASLAARLKHPHVLEAYDVVEDDGQPVLVLEYLRGASLRELTQRSRSVGKLLPRWHHLDIIRQMCLGLHYCHELRDFDDTPLGLIHRDVSPHNVFVTFEGGVRLLDFGIAKIEGRDGGTQTGLLKGKIRYMAPEQMMAGALDRRLDIYAVGVMLWEAICGRDMWSGLSDPVILQRTVNGDLPPLEPATADCPAALQAIVRQCLAFDPRDRYATAAEVEQALAAVLHDMPAPAARVGALAREHFGARDEEIHAKVAQTLAHRPSQGTALPRGRIVDWGYGSIPGVPALPLDGQSRSLPTSTRVLERGRRYPWFIGALAIAALLGTYAGRHLATNLTDTIPYRSLAPPRAHLQHPWHALRCSACARISRAARALARSGSAPTRDPPRASAPCPNSFTIATFEAGRAEACRTTERRGGEVVLYFDGTGVIVPGSGVLTSSVLLPSPRGASRHAIHLQGTGLTDWGAGVSIKLGEGEPVDLRAYNGVRLWMRSDSGVKVRIGVATEATLDETYGGRCIPEPTLQCNDHHATHRTVGSIWQEVRIPFTALQQIGWGTPAPWRPDAALEIHVGVHNGENGEDGETPAKSLSFDLWIDDLAFY